LDRKLVISRRIFDGKSDAAFEGSILIQDGTVVSVNRDKNLPKGFDGEMIDAGTKLVMPGLIDCHVHTVLEGYNGSFRGEAASAAETIRALGYLESCVRNGVTTVRDCGCPTDAIFVLKDFWLVGKIISPRLIISGQAIGATGGHAPEISIVADGTMEVTRAVRGMIKKGADWIKLMLTGGTSTPGEKLSDVQYSREEIKAAIDEAHRKGVKVTAHLSNLQGICLALECGIDCIEHAIELDDYCLDLIKRNGTYIVNCICLTNREAYDPEIKVDEHVRKKAALIAASQIKSFKAAVSKGCIVALGTDSDGYSHPFGKSVHWELQWMCKCGMRPVQALQSATSVASTVLSLNCGIIENGMVADIIFIDGDPLSNIEDSKNVTAVMQNGIFTFGRI